MCKTQVFVFLVLSPAPFTQRLTFFLLLGMTPSILYALAMIGQEDYMGRNWGSNCTIKHNRQRQSCSSWWYGCPRFSANGTHKYNISGSRIAELLRKTKWSQRTCTSPLKHGFLYDSSQGTFQQCHHENEISPLIVLNSVQTKWTELRGSNDEPLQQFPLASRFLSCIANHSIQRRPE